MFNVYSFIFSELCKSLYSTEDIVLEVNGGAAHKKRPRKERKKSLTASSSILYLYEHCLLLSHALEEKFMISSLQFSVSLDLMAYLKLVLGCITSLLLLNNDLLSLNSYRPT